MAPRIINILLTSFPGLGLPHTLVIPVSPSTSVDDLWTQVSNRLPQVSSRLILTTTSNKEITRSSSKLVSSLLAEAGDTFLPLRLSAPLCGGKGGFGSQLRAAGGRMSSRRKKNQGESNSSNRNLDGRRLRTVAEAKALAEYLALKPKMEKKEKEARRQRWEQVVTLAERREDELRNGAKGRVDGKWVEDKEEAGERTREAVFAAMRSGDYHDNLKESSSGSSGDGSSRMSDGSEDNESVGLGNKAEAKSLTSKAVAFSSRSYSGFDEDDEFMSEESEEEDKLEGERDE